MEEKKFYYATQLDPEYFDYQEYFNPDELYEANIWIGGNRDFVEWNAELINPAKTILFDIDYELQHCEYVVDDSDPDYEQKVLEEKLELLQSYTGITDKDKLKEILEIIEEYHLEDVYRGNADPEYNIIKILNIMYDTKFTHKCLRGSCQSDWIYCIYPEGTSADYLDYLEAIFFGTGTEFEITDGPVSLEQLEDEDYITVCTYTAKWKTEEVRAELAELVNCKPEDLKIRTITKTKVVRTFEYEIN